MLLKNGSLETRQPAETEGKNPQRLLGANLVEPSTRKAVSINTYQHMHN